MSENNGMSESDEQACGPVVKNHPGSRMVLYGGIRYHIPPTGDIKTCLKEIFDNIFFCSHGLTEVVVTLNVDGDVFVQGYNAEVCGNKWKRSMFDILEEHLLERAVQKFDETGEKVTMFIDASYFSQQLSLSVPHLQRHVLVSQECADDEGKIVDMERVNNAWRTLLEESMSTKMFM